MKSSSNYDYEANDSSTTINTYDLCDANSKINYIISQLSPQELETAARSSYEYLKNPVPSQRNQFAKRIVQRYLESKKGDVELALEKIKKTLKFRQEAKIEDIITAFDNDDNNNNSNNIDDCDNDEKSTKKSNTAEKLQKHLSSKKFYVQGFDNEGRSTLYFIPRNVVDHDIDSAIYSIERAIACSQSVDGTINCVVNFSNFSLSNSPPLEIGKQFLTTLRTIYAGQIHRIYLVNTPFSFSILWNIFSPFVGTDTRDKILIISNNAKYQRKELLDLYDLKEAPSWFIPGGEKNRALDLDEYLYKLQFDAAFDDQ